MSSLNLSKHTNNASSHSLTHSLTNTLTHSCKTESAEPYEGSVIYRKPTVNKNKQAAIETQLKLTHVCRVTTNKQ